MVKIVLEVLTLPNSTASEESIFSISLKLDQMLSSILNLKLANPESCFKHEPTSSDMETFHGLY